MPKNEFICDCDAINLKLVEKTLSEMPSENIFTQLSEFYKIMGDNTRCKIIFALQKNEMCVCDIANVLSMSKSSVSHQLKKMKNYGVIKCRREGKGIYYSLDDEHVSEIFAITLTHITHKEL